MTTQDKSLTVAFPEGLKELEKVQDLVLDSWHNSIDKTFDSISQFFHFSSHTLSSLNRYQSENLDLYFSGSNPAEKDVNKDKEQISAVHEKSIVNDVAVITGGIGGIGTAICQRLSQDNARIVATYISAEKENALAWQQTRSEEGMDVEVFECDVSDFDSCQKAAMAIEEEYGRVDILINCAGITSDATLSKLDEDSWHAVLDTNLDSVFNITRNFINAMMKRGYGRIINISSVNGQKGQFGQTNYSAAKAGMIGFTRSLAVELAGKGITANCVCPGYVGTSMVNAIPEHIRQAIISQIPSGRLATPAEIAHAVGFLASRESAYITGTELAVNGGLWTG